MERVQRGSIRRRVAWEKLQFKEVRREEQSLLNAAAAAPQILALLFLPILPAFQP
jgi:hypothetical protein